MSESKNNNLSISESEPAQLYIKNVILEGLSVSICVEIDIVESWLTLTAFSGF